MVAAGEASGSLEIALDRVAVQLEKNSKTQAMLKKAMIYPIVVCIVAVIVTIVMLVKVIPSYEDMFADLGTDLPWITKFYVAMSHGIQNYWFIIIPVIIAAAIGIKYFAGTNPGKHVFGKIALKLPIFKKLTVKSAAATMARTLSTLMGAGVPLIEAVDIVSGVMNNIYFKEALQDAREEITIGMPLSRPLQESGLFPPMVYQMIRIGEEAGSTEEMLDTYRYILECDLLIIDDLGTELNNSFTSSQLFYCINERMNMNRSTIISTNLSLTQLRDSYTDRVTSRIMRYRIIPLYGRDIRLLKR